MNDRTATFLKELLIEEFNVRQKDKQLVSKNIDREIVSLDEKMENVLNAIASSSSEITRKKFEGMIEEMELKKQTLTYQQTLDKEINIEKVMDAAFEILQDPYYVWTNGNVDEKRMFYQLVFRNNLQVNKKSESF